MPQAIHTDQLSKRFGRVIALDRVNLDVQEGALYALVGQNGAGKTTTIKVLMNLIRATGGSAIVLGTDSHNIRGKSYAQIGYVSENQEMPEWMKTGALLKYLREFYSTWDSDLEQSLVKQFDLPLDRKIKTLSRGMKMKLALASALAYHPRLIVLDEPIGVLDPRVRDQLIESLLERAAESTVFISSHDLAEIEASRVTLAFSNPANFSSPRRCPHSPRPSPKWKSPPRPLPLFPYRFPRPGSIPK